MTRSCSLAALVTALLLSSGDVSAGPKPTGPAPRVAPQTPAVHPFVPGHNQQSSKPTPVARSGVVRSASTSDPTTGTNTTGTGTCPNPGGSCPTPTPGTNTCPTPGGSCPTTGCQVSSCPGPVGTGQNGGTTFTNGRNGGGQQTNLTGNRTPAGQQTANAVGRHGPYVSIDTANRVAAEYRQQGYTATIAYLGALYPEGGAEGRTYAVDVR